MERAEKQQEIDFLHKCFTESDVTICADYRGLTVAQVTALRRGMRGAKATCRVVKNTLAKIALGKVLKDEDQGEVEKLLALFRGPSFIIFGRDDAVGSAKLAEKFAKDFANFELKGGWFEGKFLDRAAVAQFSRMASKEETLGKLLYLFSAPATQVVRLLNAPAQQLVQVLGAYKDKLEKGA